MSPTHTCWGMRTTTYIHLDEGEGKKRWLIFSCSQDEQWRRLTLSCRHGDGGRVMLDSGREDGHPEKVRCSMRSSSTTTTTQLVLQIIKKNVILCYSQIMFHGSLIFFLFFFFACSSTRIQSTASQRPPSSEKNKDVGHRTPHVTI